MVSRVHVPDGFLNAPTSIATGVIAAGAVALALRGSREELEESGVARAGIAGAFIFAAQMVNIPVGAGTSGHLMGGALATILVGPWTAMLVMTAVLGVQALLFADGGLTALGTNIVLLGVIPIALTAALLAIARQARSQRSLTLPVAAVAAFLSVIAAALVFTLLYVMGGTIDVPLGALAAGMVGVHTVIGLVEAVITVLVVGAVLASRPDLVEERVGGVGAEAAAPRSSARAVGAWALGLTLVLAAVAGFIASSHPDGLESVAEALGFSGAALDSAVAGGPLADYDLAAAGWIGPIVAGLVGTFGVLLLGSLTAAALRPRMSESRA